MGGCSFNLIIHKFEREVNKILIIHSLGEIPGCFHIITERGRINMKTAAEVNAWFDKLEREGALYVWGMNGEEIT